MDSFLNSAIFSKERAFWTVFKFAPSKLIDMKNIPESETLCIQQYMIQIEQILWICILYYNSSPLRVPMQYNRSFNILFNKTWQNDRMTEQSSRTPPKTLYKRLAGRRFYEPTTSCCIPIVSRVSRGRSAPCLYMSLCDFTLRRLRCSRYIQMSA